MRHLLARAVDQLAVDQLAVDQLAVDQAEVDQLDRGGCAGRLHVVLSAPMRSPAALRRLYRASERAALAALAAGLKAERAIDAAHRGPTRVTCARAERLQARAAELARKWSTADAEYERERAEARKAVTSVERRSVPKPIVEGRKAKK